MTPQLVSSGIPQIASHGWYMGWTGSQKDFIDGKDLKLKKGDEACAIIKASEVIIGKE